MEFSRALHEVPIHNDISHRWETSSTIIIIIFATKLNHEMIFFPSTFDCFFSVLFKVFHVPCVCCFSINILVRENEIKKLNK